VKQLSIRSGIVIPATAVTNAAYWCLRIGSGLCFIGHGAFGIITKREWLPYFAVVGIPADWAFFLMPLIGAVDIAVGIATLFSPRRAVLAYMAVWALWTALLRPLSGASVFELIERAGNYGVPFAFLLMLGVPRSLRDWVRPISTFDGNTIDVGRLSLVLRGTTAMLLFAHGALGALERKAMLASHYAAVGLPASTIVVVGWTEMTLALVVAIRPTVPLLVFVTVWKLSTEALFPIAGAPIWEFIERGSSYAAPAALALLMVHLASRVESRRSFV
jgi:hypothetical protein